MARGGRSPETRDALLGAAARVFLRRGLYGATVREIVGEAGLTAPALYYHFEGKEDLYAQLFRAASERFRELLEGVLDAAAGPEERLEGIARACIHFAEEDRPRLRVFYGELFRAGASEGFDVGARELRAWTRERVEETLRDLGSRNGRRIRDVPTAARFFLAVLSGLLAEQARQPDETLLEDRLAEEVVTAFLWGVTVGKERIR